MTRRVWQLTPLLLVLGAPPGYAGTTTRVSVAGDGSEANSVSGRPSISADGRTVAFESVASNLVPNDGNNEQDIFVHDRTTGATALISIATDGTQADIFSNLHRGPAASLAADGSFVTFTSRSGVFDPNDINGETDALAHDRDTDADGIFDEAGAFATEIASVASDGTIGNRASSHPSLSADGRYVAFESDSTNLWPGGATGVFVHDRETGLTTLVSVTSSGVPGSGFMDAPAISGDGRYVAFMSLGDDLVPEDGNGHADIFVHDRDADGNGVLDEMGSTSTVRVSVAGDGGDPNDRSDLPSISEDGRWVAFESEASNLVDNDDNVSSDVFVRDLATGETLLVSVGLDGLSANGDSEHASISGDGRYVAFESDAPNLVEEDTNRWTDIFVRDLQLGRTVRVNLANDGTQANDRCAQPEISTEGPYVVFWCLASNLVEDDENGWGDIFVHGPVRVPEPGAMARVLAVSAALLGLRRRHGRRLEQGEKRVQSRTPR